ncbi:MAG: hypothetical protein AAF191_00835, partial [Verrucomicrobiota bacterium]
PFERLDDGETDGPYDPQSYVDAPEGSILGSFSAEFLRTPVGERGVNVDPNAGGEEDSSNPGFIDDDRPPSFPERNEDPGTATREGSGLNSSPPEDDGFGDFGMSADEEGEDDGFQFDSPPADGGAMSMEEEDPFSF